MGLCKCGCGTKVKRTWAHGHNPKGASRPRVRSSEVADLRDAWAKAGIPYGECLCGCGQRTSLALRGVRSLGHVEGEPVFFLRGHGYTKRTKYTEENRGYETLCWIWKLWTTAEGYGKITINRGGGKVTSKLAHRWMYEQAVGPIPVGLQLDHLCRQSACVNPDHLEVVTNAENARRGSTTKLDWDKVREIRRSITEDGTTHKVLAERYGVCSATVSHVASGRNWRER